MNVQIWLRELGLSQYADAFYQHEIDESTLTSLSETDLKELGLVSLGHRKKLLSAIKKLRFKSSSRDYLATVDGEKRQVTVLFADIAGFVALSGQLGAESTYRLLNQYFEIVDDIIERYGGRVDKHIGDNVMGVFGVLLAHKDDPARAVRSAIEIRDAVVCLGQKIKHPLHIHIGIANGQVVANHMGSHIHDEYTVIGPAVNLASRLEGLSGLDEILMSDSVKQAVGDLVLAENLEQVKIKGIDHPLTVWRVQRLAPELSVLQQSAFVGRHQELQMLNATLENCMQQRKGQLIYLRGEAGIGKTRLLQEFSHRAQQQGVDCHNTIILDFGVGSYQDILRQLVEQLMGIDQSRETSMQQEQVQQFWHQRSEVAQIHLNALLQLPQTEDAQTIYEAMDNSTRIREKVRLVVELIKHCSQQRHLLITVEDLHWVEPASLNQLASCISELMAVPVLVILTSRIEGDPIDVFWQKQFSQVPMHYLDLKPLNYQESWDLVQSYENLDPTFALRCIQRAEGNPLFLEQLVCSGWSALDPQLPGSLQSVVLGRVDRLDDTDRLALQTASALGQRFSLPILRYMLADPDYTCNNLMENFLVYPEGDGYRFSHALIHDGVYFALLKWHRKQLHQRAAQWFSTRDLDLWASHLDRADAETASGAYHQAATAHYDAFRYDLALALARRGLELATAAQDRYDLTCLMAKLVQIIDDPIDSIELYREAASLAETDFQTCQAWIGVAASVRLSGGYDDGVMALDRALPLAQGLDSTKLLSKIYYFQGNFAYSKGDFEGCLKAQQQALEYAGQDPELEARALGGLADAVYASRRIRTATTCYQQCVDVAHTHGFVQIEMANRHMLAAMMRYMHDFEGAIANNQRTLETAQQLGNRRTLMYTLDNQGELLTERGDYKPASQSIEAALELSYALNNKRYRAYIMQRLARVRIYQGKPDVAKIILEDALKICNETDRQFVSPRVLGLLALVTDNDQDSENYLTQANKILSQGCISHNYFWFYRDAIETSLNQKNWSQVNHYADLLETYTSVEVFPWSQFLVARGRCLAAIGSQNWNSEIVVQLSQLYLEAEKAGLGMSLPALANALQMA